MIRKNIKNIDIDYSDNSNNKEVSATYTNVNNQIIVSNNYNRFPNEVESVDFTMDKNNSEIKDYDALITNNNDNIEAMGKIEKELEKEYQKLEENIENIYSLENSDIWYGNGVIMSNGDRPMTPQDYENMMLGNYSLMNTDTNIVEAFYNDAEWQEKIKLYKDTYNQVFMQLTNGDKTEEEYHEYMESIKNDELMISSSIYALKEEQEKLKIEQEEQKIILSDGFNKWNKTSLSTEELEANYNEYQEQYLRIYDVPDLANDLQENYDPMKFCEYAEKLAEDQGFDISDVINKQIVVYQQDFQKIYEDYQVMSTEEIAIFSYLFETEGRSSAEKYLSKKQNELNQRIGMNKAQEEIAELSLTDEGKIKETLGNMLNVGTDGLGDGITSFFSGLENAIINNEKITAEEYKVAYYIQYLEQKSNYLDSIYQVGMSTGNMLPSVTASFLTSLVAPELAPKVGQTLMGLSAYGNSKHEALTNNYSTTTAIIYGLLSAGSEVLTEKMGGILGIADNPSSNFIVKMFQEGREEFVQSYLMAGIDAIVLNKEINLSELNNEAVKSFLMGAVVAGTLNAYSTALGSITLKLNNSEISLNNEQINQVMEQIEKNPDIDIKELIERYSKTESAEPIESLGDIVQGANYENYLDFFHQFPDTRIGVLQSIVQSSMKNPERAGKIIDIVNSYFPNLSEADSIKLATDINGNVSGGVCDYAATLNMIMVYFQNNPQLFEEKFGFSLTRINKTGLTLPNDDLLLTDFYCWINQNSIVEEVDGKSTYTPKYKKKLGTSYFEGDSAPVIEAYLKSKGIDVNTTNSGIYNNYDVLPWQVNNDIPDSEINEVIINKIKEGLSKGSVVLTINPVKMSVVDGKLVKSTTPIDFYMPSLNYHAACTGGHTISVIGVQDESHILVESWGHICSLDLEQLKSVNMGLNAITISGGN